MIQLDFFSFVVDVICPERDISQLITKDFQYFLSEKKESDFVVQCEKVDSYVLPKDLRAISQSQNSISYKHQGVKYQDYYGKALTETYVSKVRLKYVDKVFLHELLYLLILSYGGKALDRKGLHKIHACGISYGSKNLILMMPSKGGKTTLFMDLLMDPDVSIISDDTPILTRTGGIKPFPLRLGCESKNDLKKRFPYISEAQVYDFNRIHFTKKYLLDISSLKNSVFVAPGKSIFIAGYRSTREKPKLTPMSKWTFFKELFKHMVVGVGLPLIIEHFFRLGWKDFLVNASIFMSRFCTAIVVVFRHEAYLLETSSDRMENRQCLMDLLNE